MLLQAVYRAFHGTQGNGLTRTQIASAVLIIGSVIFAIARTEPTVETALGGWADRIDVIIACVFSMEYVIRVWSAGANPSFEGVRGRLRYMATPMALVDLLAILPFLFGLGGQSFLVRIIRLFRILALSRLLRYSEAMRLVLESILSRRYELAFAVGLAGSVIILTAGALYSVEGDIQPEYFGSIPRALWWSICTLTTVGYGDAVPVTVLGKVFASLTAISGIGLIAMPTGILAAAFSEAFAKRRDAAPSQYDKVQAILGPNSTVTGAKDGPTPASPDDRMPLDLRRIPIPIALLEKLGREQRSFLLLGGHALNELNSLNKAFLAATNNKVETDTKQIEGLAAGLQGMVFARLLAGKLFEAWELIRTRFLGRSGFVDEMSPMLHPDATRALTELKEYYEKQRNGIVYIRNNYAFHDTEKLMERHWRRSAERHPMEWILGGTIGNNLFTGGTATCNMSVFDLYDAQHLGRGMDGFFNELYDIVRKTTTCLEGINLVILERAAGERIAALPHLTVRINPPRADSIRIPYFMSPGSIQ